MRPTYGKRFRCNSSAYELPLSPQALDNPECDNEGKPTVHLSTARLLENARRLNIRRSPPDQAILVIPSPLSPSSPSSPSMVQTSPELLQIPSHESPEMRCTR